MKSVSTARGIHPGGGARDSHVIRYIGMKTRIITTVAETGVAGYSGDGGPAKAAQLNQPHSIVLDSSDNVLICDINNHRVRKS